VSTYCGDLICLEGNAGTGKTTCCVAMAENVDGLFLPEYTETLNVEDRHALMRSFERSADHDESGVWRLAEERRAMLLARKRPQRVVLDTSLVSVVAFGIARLNFDRGGNVAETIRVYRDLLATDELVLPSKIVHLRVSEDIRQARLAKRGSCHPFLARTDVSRYLDEMRMEFFERYLPGKCWVSIDASDLPPDEATARVASELARLEARQTSEAFNAWLSNLTNCYEQSRYL
jgi:thymidylate kinase